jgi:GNAT superfamily N-acetyltransferase
MTKVIAASDSAIVLRPAGLHDCEALLGILNGATDKLLAKGIQQWTYPWEAEPLQQAIESGEQFLAIESGKVIAVFKLSRQSSNPVVEAAQPGTLYLSQLAVEPKKQSQGVGSRVMTQILLYAADLGKTLYLDCWSGNHKLKAFYQSCGLESLGDFPEEDYFITVFRAHPDERAD